MENRDGDWKYSEQGSGIGVMTKLLDEYDQVISEQAARLESATEPKDWFAITERLAPIHRAIQPFYEAVHDGLKSLDSPAGEHQSLETSGPVVGRSSSQINSPNNSRVNEHGDAEQLQAISDRANSLARTAELVLADTKNALEFFTANQAYIQSLVNQEQARAAFRLNILAAIFLPLGTIAAVFGMNLQSGLEQLPVPFFWAVFAFGALLGIAIGGFVLNYRPTQLPNTLAALTAGMAKHRGDSSQTNPLTADSSTTKSGRAS